tara:strand:- start:860 stop:1045 length:186 start_codon:yes stop_codon:yes gene_type:complete
MEDYELELELYFDDHERPPRNKVVSVSSVEDAKSYIKDCENDHDFKRAHLYKVSRVSVSLV